MFLEIIVYTRAGPLGEEKIADLNSCKKKGWLISG